MITTSDATSARAGSFAIQTQIGPGGSVPISIEVRALQSASAHGVAPAPAFHPAPPAFQPMPVRPSHVIQPDIILVPDRGWHRLHPTPPDPHLTPFPFPQPAPEQSLLPGMTATASSSITKKELAFLDDKNMSVEEKLFRFMALMVKKSDQQLVNEMKSIAGKYGSSPSSTSSGSSSAASDAQSSGGEEHQSGGGFFGFISDAVGAVGDLASSAVSTVAGAAESAAKELGGPLLAAAATALGFPELAPIALQYGGELSAGLVHLVGQYVEGEPSGSGSSSGNPSGGTVASAGGGEAVAGSNTNTATSASSTAAEQATDEKIDMINLQRMAEAENAMFSALSNVLKSMNDARMTAVQNIR